MMWSKVTEIIYHPSDPRATIIAEPSSSLKQQPLARNPLLQPPTPETEAVDIIRRVQWTQALCDAVGRGWGEMGLLGKGMK